MADLKDASGNPIGRTAIYDALGNPATGSGAAAGQVQGATPNGSLNAGNPVLIGVSDMAGGQNVRTVSSGSGADPLNPVFTLAAMGFGLTGLFSCERLRVANIFKPQNAVAVAAETTIWTPAAGKRFRLMGACVTSSVAGNLVFRDNTGGTIVLVIPCLAGAPVSLPPMGNGILSAAVNNLLTCTGPAASTLSGVVFGIEE